MISQKVDVVLINPKHVFEKTRKKAKTEFALAIYPPLGILYLASVLEAKGFRVEIIDAIGSDNSIKEIIDVIRKNKARVVGITATTPQIRGAVQIAEQIKKIFGRNVVVGIGGSHVSADKKFGKKFRCFDFSLEGEGEKTFPDLVVKILEGKKVRGHFVGEETKDLDSIPFPARHLVNPKKYFIEPYGQYIATIHTVRGCPFNCVFCSKPVTCRRVRFRSPTNVVDEIEECIQKYQIKMVLFTDDTFTISKKRAAQICREILKRKIKIDWFCETRANLIDRRLIKLMYKSGCREISFGVESGNEKLRLEVIRKGVTDKELIKAFALCREFKIKAPAFCMMGFPLETKENMYETYRLCLKLKPNILGLHLTTLMPGADLFQMAVKEKKVESDVWDRYARGEIDDQPVYLPDDMSLEALKAIQKDIYHKYYFRLAYLVPRFFDDLRAPRLLALDIRMAINLLFQPKTATGRQ